MDRTSAVSPNRWDQQPYGDDDGYGRYDEYDDEEEPKRSKAFLAVLVLLLLILAGLLFFMVRSLGGDGGEEAPTVEVPNVIAMQQAEAEAAIRAQNLEPRVVQEAAEEPPGTVVDQSPSAGESLEEGAEVVLTVSTGPETVPVTDVVGRTVDEARQLLTEQGFELIQTTPDPDSDQPEGTVISQDPPANTPVPLTQQITLVVSAGEDTTPVPEVVGLQQAEAEQRLRDGGFTPAVQQAPSNDRPVGEVISQDPQPGTEHPEGTTVTITVSSGPSQGQIPDVMGRQQDAAIGILENAGFEVTVEEEDVFNPNDDGRVIDQSPDGGQTGEQGTTVVIVVGRFIGDGGTTVPPGGD
jgi:eukaryotic-like serine/threonine-protein kinase